MSTKAVIIGLSGPSSSGKTTLGRLLREVFTTSDEVNSSSNLIRTSLFILHADDFYKSDVDIPKRTISSPEHGTREIQDWDCVEAIDLPRLQETLQYISIHGNIPPDSESKEDKNSTGDSHVSTTEIEEHRDALNQFLTNLSSTIPSTTAQSNTKPKNVESNIKEIRICILDGFLLYPPPPSSISKPNDENATMTTTTTSTKQLDQLHDLLAPLLTLKLFITSTRAQTIQRRAARAGYVTMEGFWTDPPGYVEDLVWSNYARDHEWLFKSREDIDGGIMDREVAEREGVLVGPGKGDVKMTEILSWGVDVLKDMIEQIVKDERGNEE